MVPWPYGNLYSLIFPDRVVRELLPFVALRTAFSVAGVGVVAPPLDPLPVRGGDGCCFLWVWRYPKPGGCPRTLRLIGPGGVFMATLRSGQIMRVGDYVVDHGCGPALR